MRPTCSPSAATGWTCSAPAADAANLFGTVGYHRPVDYVFVNGRMTVRDGRLLTVDEERERLRGEAAVRRLLAHS